ncbi:DNA photolyase family protein [Candidatus Binatia bacterium]|nr:DNA photolyase family protein [Candidatus Binatia bacterium]
MRIALHWFRRDLRVEDNTALFAASRRADLVVPLFVLDDHLLRAPDLGAPRVAFLLDSLHALARDLEQAGSRLVLRRGDPLDEVLHVARALGAEAIFVNDDYAPYGRRRDAAVRAAAEAAGIAFHGHADLVLVQPDACVKDDGKPYTVFTPFARRWRAVEKPAPVPAPTLRPLPAGLARKAASAPLPATSAELGLPLEAQIEPGGARQAQYRLAAFLHEHVLSYRSTRDVPALDATSHLSPHLKFGTISPRTVYARVAEAIGSPQLAQLDPQKPGRALDAASARRLSEAGTFLNELCWREFYQAILFHFPHVARGAFQEGFRGFRWPESDERLIAAWRDGRTGFPIVDAAMRQLAATGWMHNRLRMVVAMFLTKTLLVDYRTGERIFMQRLVDGDLAANNGGWQWSASTGTDAAPYFRIFNPLSQAKKFDPDGEFVRRWVPELRDVPAALIHEPTREPLLLAGTGYPPPCVDYAERRARALAILAPLAKRA